jgi:hypothetical protein
MRYFVGGAEQYLWFQEKIFPWVVGIHAAEAGWMGVKLGRKGVGMWGNGNKGRDGMLWWKWVGSTFVEGFGAHERFNALVERGREEKGKRH